MDGGSLMVEISVEVVTDKFTEHIAKAFDFQFTGKSSFTLPDFICPKKSFNIGLIVGSSGSGKTQILKKYYGFKEEAVNWNKNKAVISHFNSIDEAVEKVFAVGLSSIPTLCKPYHVLSNGEQFRADLSRRLKHNSIIDEFTSVVNRATAKSVSVSLSRYIRNKKITGVIFSSCHRDIIPWLQPDWVFDCDAHTFVENVIDVTKLKRVATIDIK